MLSQLPTSQQLSDNEELGNKNKYLVSVITTNDDCTTDIKRRTAAASQKLDQMKNMWQGTSKETKLYLPRAYIFLVAPYGCDTWALNKSPEKRITAFAMKCYGRAFRTSRTERKPNKEILAESGVVENWLENTIKARRKVRYFCHIKRQNGLQRLMAEGTVPGTMEKGQPWHRQTQEYVISRRWPTCSRPNCVQVGNEKKNNLERTHHMTNIRPC